MAAAIRTSGPSTRATATFLQILSAVALAVTFQVLAVTETFDQFTIVPLQDVYRALADGVAESAWSDALRYTGQGVALSFVTASVLGVIIGYTFHRLPRTYSVARPLLEAYYSLPIFIFYPVVVRLIGLNLWAAVIIVGSWALVGMILNAVIGFDRVPSGVDKYVRSLQLSPRQYLRHVRFPSALPSIVTGLRVAFLYSLVGTVGVEFILSTRGLGRLINDSYASFRTADMYAAILLVIATALVLNVALSRFESNVARRRGHAVSYQRPLDEERGPLSVRVARAGILAAVLLFAWVAISAWVGEDRLSSPWTTVSRLVTEITDGELISEMGGTLRATLWAFLISGVVGVTVGFVLGGSRLLTRTYMGWVSSMQAMPKIILYPIILALFGYSVSAKVALGALHALPIVILYTMSAVAAVSAAHLRYAASIQLTRRQHFRYITLPSATPEILTSLRIGAGVSFLGVLLGEILSGQSGGTGHVILQTAIREDTPKMMAYVLAIAAAAMIVNWTIGQATNAVARRS